MIKTDVSWSEIDVFTKEFCDNVIRGNTKYDTIVGIGRGGLVPAIIVSHCLGVPLVPIMWQKRDGNKQYEQVIHDYVKTLPNDTESMILIVDDINDSGVTLEEVDTVLRKWLNIYDKSAIVRTYTVYQKPSTKYPSTYYSELVDDMEWIIFPWEE